MAANYLTKVGDLATEVASLLGIDNLDKRIHTWISLAFNDLIRRNPGNLFYTSSVTTIASGETGTLDTTNSIPVVAIFKTSSTIYVPRQQTAIDYARVAHAVSGGSLASGSVPLHWSIGPDTGTPGRGTLYVYPTLSASVDVTIIWTGKNLTGPSASTDYLHLPYHFEHVIIWGAAYHGAKAVNHPAVKVFLSEHEEAISNMYHILTYSPDTVPVRRSITGEYGGTQRLRPIPRIPDTIG